MEIDEEYWVLVWRGEVEVGNITWIKASKYTFSVLWNYSSTISYDTRGFVNFLNVDMALLGFLFVVVENDIIYFFSSSKNGTKYFIGVPGIVEICSDVLEDQGIDFCWSLILLKYSLDMIDLKEDGKKDFLELQIYLEFQLY